MTVITSDATLSGWFPPRPHIPIVDESFLRISLYTLLKNPFTYLSSSITFIHMVRPLHARWGSLELLDSEFSIGTRARVSEALAKAFLKDLFQDGDTRLTALTTHASTLYGRSCSVNKQLVARGGYHVLLRLEFDDAAVWAARICLPTMVESHIASLNTESEVATLLYLKDNVSFPVPEVYGFNYDVPNSVGSPYVFLELIEGET